MTLVAARTLVDDQHVQGGAYVLSIEGVLFAVIARRVSDGKPEALIEDVRTPTRAERYVTGPVGRRRTMLVFGHVVDADAETGAEWVPVAELIGCQLVRASTRVGVSKFEVDAAN